MTGSGRAGNFLRHRLPYLFLLLRRLRYARGRERLDPSSSAVLATLCGGELRVLSGPFAGMRYLPVASGSGLLPKIVGSYEMEIHSAIAASLRRAYRRVINIGCGEGYYAVGYARALPAATVFAFDPDVLARSRLRALARLNGVTDRIRVGVQCRPQHLGELSGKGCLVVCDCEGCERELLDPQISSSLRDSDILVEIHDFLDSTGSILLAQRFNCTHEILLFDVQPRSAYQAPNLDRLSAEQRNFALWEGRPARTKWGWMRARSW